MWKNYLSLKGVGSITIVVFFAAVGDIRRFDSTKKDWWVLCIPSRESAEMNVGND